MMVSLENSIPMHNGTGRSMTTIIVNYIKGGEEKMERHSVGWAWVCRDNQYRLQVVVGAIRDNQEDRKEGGAELTIIYQNLLGVMLVDDDGIRTLGVAELEKMGSGGRPHQLADDGARLE